MPSAEKVSVTLTPEMVRVIRESVDRGEYASASEVVREALRGWQRQRVEDAERLEAVRARIHRSLEDPRPSLSESDVDDELGAFFEQVSTSGDDAAA
jgi:antitoxin ParD1/3/4